MEVRKADAAFRRLAIILVVAGTAADAFVLGALARYQGALVDWVTRDAGRSAPRIELIFAIFAALLLAPLIAMAFYLSSLGSLTIRVREFPPPGFRVFRDTPILRGFDAFSRGRSLQGIAVVLIAASVLIALYLWRLASVFTEQ